MSWLRAGDTTKHRYCKEKDYMRSAAPGKPKRLSVQMISSGFFFKFCLATTFILISCSSQQRPNNRPEIVTLQYSYPSADKRYDISANVVGIDSILCGLIDTFADTTIFEKAQYDLLSEECRRNMDKCIKGMGLTISFSGNKVKLFNPAVRLNPSRATRVFFIEFFAGGSIENNHGSLHISINEKSFPFETRDRVSYSLKVLNGKFYVDKCDSFERLE